MFTRLHLHIFARNADRCFSEVDTVITILIIYRRNLNKTLIFFLEKLKKYDLFMGIW